MSDTQKRLARNVTVGSTTYGPDDDVPADILAGITNPLAWVPIDAQPEAPPSGPAGTKGGFRLATVVAIGGATYGPDDVIPDDVAAQITNPKAWAGGKLPSAKPAAEPVKAAKPAPPAKAAP